MRSTVLAVTTTLVLGSGVGGLAFATVHSPARTAPPIGGVSAPPGPSASADVCSDPTSHDPRCVVVVQAPSSNIDVAVPAPTTSSAASAQGTGSTPATGRWEDSGFHRGDADRGDDDAADQARSDVHRAGAADARDIADGDQHDSSGAGPDDR